MHRSMKCLLLAAFILPFIAPEAVHAQAAKAKSAPVIPRYDPPDQPFRMAPMPQSTRSIVVPLATNLHLAFDTALLRTHTVWSGRGLALLGPQYGLPKSPFISTNDATVLWTMPPVFPWAVGKLPEKDEVKLPSGWRLGELGSIPGGLPAAIREASKFESHGPGLLVTYSKPHPTERNASMGVHEYLKLGSFSANATVRSIHVFGLDDVAWFLAHAEMGKASLLTNTPNTALIERTNGVVLIMLHAQRTVDGESVVRLVAVDRQVDYEVETVTEQGVEKGNPKHRVAGQQGRVYVQVENPGRKMVNFVVRTEVFSDKTAALRSLAPENAPEGNAGKFMLKMGVGPRLVAQVALPSVVPSKPILAGNRSYHVEAFPLPPKSNMQVTGMTFLLNGDLAVCTWSGDVWVIRGAQGDARGMKYVRLVRGLCEPMGILSSLREVYVGTKQGLYHIGSLERDEPPERIRCVDQGWGYSGSYNAFVYGPVLDKRDNFILASAGHSGRWDSRYMGWAFSIAKYPRQDEQGNITPICSGLREPNGIGTFGPDRDVFVSENQGQWMAACKLNHVTPGKFYGHPSAWPAPQEEYGKHTRFDPPAVWFPYKLARSTTGIVEITDDRFGPFKGQLMVGDFQNAIVTRVQLEKVNGEYQGAVWPFLKQFQSGVNRLAYGPDGKLYVGGCQAPVSWKAVAPLEFALERISYTGKLPFEVKEVHALRDGFELTFTQPVEAKAAANPESYDVTQYGYKYHAKYGSPEFDHDGKENAATAIKVAGATVSPDKLKVRLKLEGWKTGYVTMVRSLDVKNAGGDSLVNDTFWYTLNQLPK